MSNRGITAFYKNIRNNRRQVTRRYKCQYSNYRRYNGHRLN